MATSIDDIGHALDTLEYQILGVEPDDWAHNPAALQSLLHRLLEIGVQLSDIADTADR